MDEYQPRHRANKLVRTFPRIQPAPRHADSIVTRLGGSVFDMDAFKGLLREITVDNPFRYRGGAS